MLKKRVLRGERGKRVWGRTEGRKRRREARAKRGGLMSSSSTRKGKKDEPSLIEGLSHSTLRRFW